MNEIQQKITISMRKLEYLYKIQDDDFWYLNTILVRKEDLESVNRSFARVFGDSFHELGLRLGSSFLQGSKRDLMTELYTFNETLTRLLSAHTETETLEFMHRVDSTLMVKTLLKLLLLKLGNIREHVKDEPKGVELKLIEDILLKNVSQRVLEPFHSLLIIKANSRMYGLLV